MRLNHVGLQNGVVTRGSHTVTNDIIYVLLEVKLLQLPITPAWLKMQIRGVVSRKSGVAIRAAGAARANTLGIIGQGSDNTGVVVVRFAE